MDTLHPLFTTLHPGLFGGNPPPINVNRSASPLGVNNSARPLGVNNSASPLGVNSSARPLGVNNSARPLGVNSSASPLGVPADLQSADKKGSTYLTADLQSASSENAQRRYEKPTAADCKSAIKRSNLFCLRIANPQGRLTGSRLSLPPSGLAFPLAA